MTEGHPAPALEYLLVKQGQLTMTVGGQVFTLEAGDSLRFDASLRHTYQNSENSLMQAYCINQYPRA